VGDEGLEPSSQSGNFRKNAGVLQTSGAESGAADPNLNFVIESWLALADDARAAVVALVVGCLGHGRSKGQEPGGVSDGPASGGEVSSGGKPQG